MSTVDGNNQGIFGSFPYEVVITPATIAGLVVALAQYLLQIAQGPFSLSLDGLVLTLIGAIATIGFLVAVLAIVVSGARTDVLAVGIILTYVAYLVAFLVQSIYNGGGLDLTVELFLGPLSDVILVAGIGIGVNWIGVDVSL